ncbi:MAG: FKBP-type peptidyl-prolyl cis-trans isomerase [Bacteroidota bacterium]|nr:FKBP-type peptidyl-prolyl cis-trans isomerase [Bacteroidota bacterium]
MDKLSYSLGVTVGANLKQQEFKLENVDDFISGLRNVIENKKLEIDEKEVNEIVNEYFKEIQEKVANQQAEIQANFFAENGKKEDIITTESGLQYKVIKEGEGAMPAAEDNVSVHYHGTLLDGKVFDSSVDRGEPVTFPVNGVIKGWQEAIQLMKEGGKLLIFVPSELAYGAQGAGNVIPPHTPLAFEVELIKIIKE